MPETLLSIYHRLDFDAKLLLQLKALIYHRYSNYDLYSLLKNSNVMSVNGGNFEIKDVTKKIKYLRSLKLLVSDGTCDVRIMHQACIDGIKNTAVVMAATQRLEKVNYFFYSNDTTIGELRFYIYGNHGKKLARKLLEETQGGSKFEREMIERAYSETLENIPFDINWIQGLDEDLQDRIGFYHLSKRVTNLEDISKFIAFFQPQIKTLSKICCVIAEYYFWRGDFDNVKLYIEKMTSPYHKLLFTASMLFCNNELESARQCYEQALVTYKKLTKKKKAFISGYHGIFYVLSLLKTKDIKSASIAIKTALSTCNDNCFEVFKKLNEFILFLSYSDNHGTTKNYDNVQYLFFPTTSIIMSAISSWFQKDQVRKNLKVIKGCYNDARNNGYLFVAKIAAAILGKHEKDASEYIDYVDNNLPNLIQLLEIFPEKKSWERALDRLAFISNNIQNNSKQQHKNRRLSWLLDPMASYSYLQPIEQIRNKSGSWSKGRVVSLKKLYEKSDALECMTEQDHNITKALDRGWYNGFEWDRDAVLPKLVDHPNIFHMKNQNMKLSLISGKPELIIKQLKDSILIMLSVNASETGSILRHETIDRYSVIGINETHVQLYSILTHKGLKVPMKAKEQVLNSLQQIAEVLTVYSPMELNNIKTVESSNSIQVHLYPQDGDLQASINVRPFVEYGPYCSPGEGSPVIVTLHQGEKVQTVRDLESEEIELKKLITACPSMNGMEQKDLAFSNPEQCLKFLDELRSFDGNMQMLWPKGETMQIKTKLSFDNISLRINQNRDWFELSGEVQIDETTKMDIKSLLDLVDNSNSKFIPLEEGKFLSLTQHFMERLKQIKSISQKGEDHYSIHKLGAFALNNVIQDFKDVESDATWQKQIAKLKSLEKATTTLPKTLQANLRNYQKEGYDWLCRMSNWDLGACLADDMGLGKTLQAIAILLKQSSKGASIVITPTSVAHNWFLEIEKFAPSLKPLLFAEQDREKLTKSIQKKHVIICSYGLLQTSIDILKITSWQVIVLDEAQAIKNSATKRARAALQLEGCFRLALTGTPIENHLGELWSLFNFLNPGFLGTQKRFFEKFVQPIEQNNDSIVRDGLKRLIQPFILRRLKKDVLKELPSRTEKVIEVDFDDKEMAFYEEMRKQAQNSILNSDIEAQGQRRIKILSEITKLRQVCCHASLVIPDISLPNAKLKQFERLLDNLLENNHKALVFSQFVRYLSIIRKILDDKKIDYQYLDGQTPAKKRKKFIDNFQNGKGDVFLLSLKAGGIGLNLTEADYVILLDPWWNPAIEDQAADRSHRIGQKKPVTIYRLICKNTIEEKIIEMHKLKRNLANDLLSGADTTGKLSEEELLNMIGN